MSANPGILSHVSLGTNRFEEAGAFYDKVSASLGIGRVLDLSEHRAVAYGRVYPEFWIQAPHDRQHAQTANGAPARARTTAKNITAALCAIWTTTKSKQWLG